MKPTELRIGNYFSPTRYAKGLRIPTAGIGEVVTLESDNVQWVFSDQIPAQVEKWNSSKYYEIEPIPLTEDWLLKFRLERMEPDYRSHLPYYRKYLPPKDNTLDIRRKNDHWEDTLYWKDIKYVHQLQNLYFALTGEELVIQPVPTSSL